jgi:hypothetical protein
LYQWCTAEFRIQKLQYASNNVNKIKICHQYILLGSSKPCNMNPDMVNSNLNQWEIYYLKRQKRGGRILTCAIEAEAIGVESTFKMQNALNVFKRNCRSPIKTVLKFLDILWWEQCGCRCYELPIASQVMH